jgi:sugar/nucleoside kinase (ribokinase family)
MVIEVMPSEEEDVSELMPAMVESWRSIGAATDAAMVSALAPGSVAVMLMVGKSTAGSAATESSR